jgi:hypothetical protein
MVSPAAGKVVLVPFPFSDLSQSKLRPAVVVANAGRGDWVLCQITSNRYAGTLRLGSRPLIPAVARPNGPAQLKALGVSPGNPSTRQQALPRHRRSPQSQLNNLFILNHLYPKFGKSLFPPGYHK